MLIAKDEHEEYRECLDCGEIFDPAEQEPGSDEDAGAKFGESLSDA
jgi:rubredoxin